jgi:membrane protease subunit HflK
VKDFVMPWNSQGGGGGPWSGGGSGGGGVGGGQQPNIEEMLRRSQDKVRRFIPGGFGSGRGIAIAVLIVLVLWGLSGFYRVQENERGLELVFGKWNEQITAPGLRWRFPTPIGEVLTPAVTQINRLNVGFRDSENVGGRSSSARDVLGESLMLTSDQNISDVDFTVQWRIANPADYLFNILAPEDTVKAAAESAMREVVGQTKLDDLLTTAREVVQDDTRILLQSILDGAFNDVQRARQDQERLQNQAEAYRNRIVPTARGEAAGILEEAAAYRERVVKEAQGEASRFDQILATYQVAPDVTRRRLYIETLRDVLRGANKVILDEGAGGGQGVVPYLPLNELNRNRTENTGDQQ